MAQSILEGRDQETLLRLMAGHARALDEAELAAVALSEPEDGSFVVRMADGRRAAAIQGMRVPSSGTLMGGVVASGRPAVLAGPPTELPLAEPIGRRCRAGPDGAAGLGRAAPRQPHGREGAGRPGVQRVRPPAARALRCPSSQSTTRGSATSCSVPDYRPYALLPIQADAGVMDSDGGTTLESLNRNACLELMPTVPVGRIGISITALPVILPVNFALVGEKIVFRTIPRTKLDAAAVGAVVAFEVDSYSPDGTSGWSVLVQGRCSKITDPAELAALEAIPWRAWAFNKGVAQRLVCIETSFVTRRRFQRRET